MSLDPKDSAAEQSAIEKNAEKRSSKKKSSEKKEKSKHTPNAANVEVFQKIAGQQVPKRKGQKSAANKARDKAQGRGGRSRSPAFRGNRDEGHFGADREPRDSRGRGDERDFRDNRDRGERGPRNDANGDRAQGFRNDRGGRNEQDNRGFRDRASGFNSENQVPVHGSEQNRPLAEGNFEAPTRVGGERNEHGTRVARRVECNRCKAIDHVSYLDKDKDFALCRGCAEEMMNVFEVGRKKRMATRDVDCNLCGEAFGLPVTAEDDGDPLCTNCLREWLGWQGSLDMTVEERSANEIMKTRPGVALRRKKGSPKPNAVLAAEAEARTVAAKLAAKDAKKAARKAAKEAAKN